MKLQQRILSESTPDFARTDPAECSLLPGATPPQLPTQKALPPLGWTQWELALAQHAQRGQGPGVFHPSPLQAMHSHLPPDSPTKQILI